MIERKIVAPEISATAGDAQNVVALLYINRCLTDCSIKCVTDLFPVKNLPGIEGPLEIKVDDVDLYDVGRAHSAEYSQDRQSPPEKSALRVAKFLAAKGTWTVGSPSIAQSYCSIFASLSSSVCAWAGANAALKVSRSAAGKFPGGPSSPRSSRR